MSPSRNVLTSWIILGYLLNFIEVSTQEPSSLHFLREPPQRLYLQRGQTNQLDCSYEDGGGAVSHSWYRNELPVDEHVVSSYPNGTLAFVVGDGSSPLNTHIEGSYRCCITDATLALCGTASQVSYPTLGPAVISSSRRTAVIGETFRLSCSVEGDPSPAISWSKDGEGLPTGGDRVVVLPNRAVQISQVEFFDEGSYICTAENLAGMTMSQAEVITVTGESSADLSQRGQIMNVTSQHVVGQVGGDALLECQVRDISNVGVHWTKGTENIPGDRWETIGHGNLLLKNLALNDTGSYVCTSYDSMADKVRTEPISLTVQAAPVITRENERKSMVRPEGLLAVFKCEVFGVPSPSVTWYLNGARISLQGRFSQTYSTSLWVRNLDPGDSGLYQCYVSNSVGSVYTTYYLEVIWSQIGPVIELQVRKVNSSAVTIRWTIPNQTIIAYLVMYTRLPDGKEEDNFIFTNASQDGVDYNHTLTELHPNSNYSIAVRTCDPMKRFSRQATVYATTLESAPSAAPEIVNLTSTPTTLSAQWEPVAPDNLNGALSYTVLCLGRQLHDEECRVLEEPAVTTYVFTNLLPGVEYLVRIAVATNAGKGPYSLKYPRITPIGINCTAPDLVPLSANVVNSSFVALSWPPPSGPERELIRRYRLTISIAVPNFGETRVDFVLLDANATSYNKSNAVQHSTYSIMFYAIGDCGEGPVSKSIIQMPEEVIIDLIDVVPHNIQAQALSADIIRIKWDPPASQEPILSYTVDYGIISDPASMESQVSLSSEAILLGLETYTFYQIKVTANFAHSTASSQLQYCRTAEGAPGSVPIKVRASAVDSASVNVSWERPEFPNGEIIAYIVYYISSARLSEGWRNATKIVREDRRSGLWFLLRSLQAETRYTIRVAAVTRPGRGPLSQSIDATTLHTESGMLFFNQATDIRKGILIGICLAILCIIVCVGLLLYHRRVSCCYRSLSHPSTLSMHADVPGHYRMPQTHKRQEGYPLKRNRQHSWNISEREIESLVMGDLAPNRTDRVHVQVHHIDSAIPLRGAPPGDRSDTYLAIQEPCQHTSHRIPHDHPTELDPSQVQCCSTETAIDRSTADSDEYASRAEPGGCARAVEPHSANPSQLQNVEVICHMEPQQRDITYSSKPTTPPRNDATSAIPNSDRGIKGLAPSIQHCQGLPSACRCSPYRRREGVPAERELSGKQGPLSEANARMKCGGLGDASLTDEGMKESTSSLSSLDGDSGLNGDFDGHTFGGCDTRPDFLERVMELLS